MRWENWAILNKEWETGLEKGRNFSYCRFLCVCVHVLEWITGQNGRNIKQIRAKEKEWRVGNGEIPGGNYTGRLIILEISQYLKEFSEDWRKRTSLWVSESSLK